MAEHSRKEQRGGRPRNRDSEICPNCGRAGYSYAVPSWNPKYKDAIRHMYLRFIHEDRTLSYCYIEKRLGKKSQSESKSNLQVRSEYHRLNKNVTTYLIHDQNRYLSRPHFDYKITKALPIVIYVFYVTNELTKKLRKVSLKLGELDQLLKDKTIKGQPEAYQFIQKLQSTLKNNDTYNITVTVGEDAFKKADRIRASGSFRGKITYLYDKYAVLTEILKKRETKQKRSQRDPYFMTT
jgi:hypothetical protein